MRQQQGNVLFIILIAVVLFAALSYAVTRSSRGSGNSDIEQRKLDATSILNYTTSIANAVTRLRLINQCSELEISFENPLVADYVNANSPTDRSCHVFDQNGGGISPVIHAHGTQNSFIYTGNMAVDGVGSSEPELAIVWFSAAAEPPLEYEICSNINEGTGFSSSGVPGVLSNYSSTIWYKFVGAVSWGGYQSSSGGVYGNSSILGKTIGCVRDNGASRYTFFHVLIER